MSGIFVSPRDDAFLARLCALAFPGWRGQRVELAGEAYAAALAKVDAIKAAVA